MLIGYVLIFCVAYTLDYRLPIDSVRMLTFLRCVLLFAACCYLIALRRKLAACLDPFAACILAIIVVGAVSGLFGGADRFAYLRHAFQYSFLLAFYLVGREIGTRPIREPAVKFLSIAILTGYAIAAVTFALTPGLQSGSYSYQPNLALLAVSYGASAGRWIMVALGSLLIIIGNKRAVYLALALLLAIALALRLERKPSWQLRTVVVAMAAPAIGFVLAFIVLQVSMLLGAPTASSVVARFNVESTLYGDTEGTEVPGTARAPEGSQAPTSANSMRKESSPQKPKVDPIVRFTSARNIEFEAVWEMARQGPAEAVFGRGLGSQFTMKYISPTEHKLLQYDRDQADVAPVHIALTSGIPLAAVFTALYCGMLLMIFVRIDQVEGADRALAMFSISIALDVMLGFNPTNPLCWLALGAISRRLLPEFSLAPAGWLWRRSIG
ncbi:hypothetical protein J6500_07915 [Bradyrhizobium sp. WSM 1704]|uniref:hypothetical protein n=1 Tax=Bradyrhizobium semiaridum TaxID=2821404 RepID=UPI001CE317CF|nr:hypothetical protein [Bradyrhizobium semiaridum]MCA6121825.1 hypothetical protein [Bradyrhizobium semiaridum]